MEKRFEIVFLEEVLNFLRSLNPKHNKKILYNIRKAQFETNAELFNKLYEDIWEFRTLYDGIQYRLLAFWDKSEQTKTIVISTHAFVKKSSKVPKKEIHKAIQLKTKYFINKSTGKLNQ